MGDRFGNRPAAPTKKRAETHEPVENSRELYKDRPGINPCRQVCMRVTRAACSESVSLRGIAPTAPSGLAFHQGRDRREVVVADDEVLFLMPGVRPVDGRKGPIVNGEHRLLKPWTPPLLAAGQLGGDHDQCVAVNTDAASTEKVARTVNSRSETTC